MAVVIITSQTGSPKAAKATIKYIVHRREREERITRELFDAHSTTQKRTAYRAIDKAPKGTTFFRIAISPDPNGEDRDKTLNLRELTRKTLRALKRQFPNQRLYYFGAVHGHTENRHVNLLLLLRGRITRTHLRRMREAAGGNARQQSHALAPAARPRAPFRKRLGNARTRSRLLNRQPSRQAAFGVRMVKTAPPYCPVCKRRMSQEGLSVACKFCTLSLFAGRSFLKERASNQMLHLRRSREVVGEW